MISMTYGQLPTVREQFDAAFGEICKPSHPYVGDVTIGPEARRYCPACGRGIRDDAHKPPHCKSIFSFTNDPRVGDCALTANELWAELNDALIDYQKCGQPAADAAGQWCSDVLGVLGFEWI